MSLSRWDWKWWLATVLTIVSVAATIAPAYWSYICRSSGKFCEGSIVAPAADLDSAKRLSGKLADKESRRTFKTLTAREAGFWPFGPRYDVIAEYTDRPSEVIGSVPQNMVDSYHVDPSSGSIFFYGSANSSRNGNVRAFIIDDQLDRRTLTLGSAIGPTSNVHIKNLHFDRKLKEIVFDVEIDNRHLEVNEKNVWYFRNSSQNNSARMHLRLSDTMHVEKAFTYAALNPFDESEARYKQCEADARLAAKQDGELFVCFKWRVDLSSYRHQRHYILAWNAKSGQLTDVSSVGCTDGSGVPARSPNNRVIVVPCNGWMKKDDTTATLFQIFVSGRSQQREDQFTGRCKSINFWNIEILQNPFRVIADLETDCTEITSNGRTFKTPAKTGKNGESSTTTIEIAFDSRLAPWKLFHLAQR